MPEKPLRERLYEMQQAVTLSRNILKTLPQGPPQYGPPPTTFAPTYKLFGTDMNKLVEHLNTIDYAVQALGKEGVGVRPSPIDIDGLTRKADERSRRQMGSFEASLIDAWVKADRPNREVLYDAVKQIASKYFW